MKLLPVTSAEKIAALQQNSYFAMLSQQLLERLAQSVFLRLYERGEIICWQGEPGQGLYILRRGSVKLFKLSARGRELIIRILEEGASFNEVPAIDHGPNPVNVAALVGSEIWLVEGSALRQVLAESPEMAQAVIVNLSANLRSLVQIVEELSFYQVTNRLARLLSQSLVSGTDDQSVYMLTQEKLAARLGTVREVVARSLRELQQSGAIRLHRRRIEIVDPELLAIWAQEPIGNEKATL